MKRDNTLPSTDQDIAARFNEIGAPALRAWNWGKQGRKRSVKDFFEGRAILIVENGKASFIKSK